MGKKTLSIYQDGVSIITGGASGIGLAFGKALASRGCHVILADLQKELAEKEAELINSSGGKATAVSLDVRDSKAVKKLIEETREAHGRIDTLFNNAGVAVGWEVKDDLLEDWNYIIDVNIRGVVNGTLAVYPIMIEQGFGHIINIASGAGLVPATGAVSYGMTKHAVVGLSTSLRGQALEYGVRVSVVCPSFVDTPILKGGVYGRVDARVVKKLENAPKPSVTIGTSLLVRKVLPQIEKNRSIIVEPMNMKIMWWVYRLCPDFFLRLVTKGWFHIKKKLNL